MTMTGTETQYGRPYTALWSNAASSFNKLRIDFRPETRGDRYSRLSDEAANNAVEWGLAGDEKMAAMAAAVADAYAEVASVWDAIEDLCERHP